MASGRRIDWSRTGVALRACCESRLRGRTPTTVDHRRQSFGSGAHEEHTEIKYLVRRSAQPQVTAFQ
jgi:hypothetical protein